MGFTSLRELDIGCESKVQERYTSSFFTALEEKLSSPRIGRVDSFSSTALARQLKASRLAATDEFASNALLHSV